CTSSSARPMTRSGRGPPAGPGPATARGSSTAPGRRGPAGAVAGGGGRGGRAVLGPTGGRDLADDRQQGYVVNGWNLTGDTYLRDSDGYYWYQARSDDMIISAGYNLAGPEGG